MASRFAVGHGCAGRALGGGLKPTEIIFADGMLSALNGPSCLTRSREILFGWLADWHCRYALAGCGRVAQSCLGNKLEASATVEGGKVAEAPLSPMPET